MKPLDKCNFPNIYFKFSAGLKAKVRTKRQYNSQRYISKSPTNLDKLSLNQVIESEDEEVSVGDSTFILKPGTIPPARQMFYQVRFGCYFGIKFV